MLVAFSICQRDESIAQSTLDWAFSLDGQLPYEAFLSFGEGFERAPIIDSAERLFRKVTVLDSYAPDAWPQGKNATFQNFVRHLDSIGNKESFFWWEPDATPLKKGWLTAIDDEHKRGGKPFTGFVYDQIGFMDCVGVYPPNFMDYSPTTGMLCRAAPWDRCTGAEIMQHVHRANDLFQMVHDIDGFPPTFTSDLSSIRKDAVLFHKCKDGTLIEQLSKGAIKRFIGGLFKQKQESPKERIVVVFPVCAKDIDQAIAHAKWLQKQGVKWGNLAVVASDTECPNDKRTELVATLVNLFQGLSVFIYPTPQDKTYPGVANYAFARVAEYMANGTAPWLWLEADAVILRSDWLDVLQKEYDACGKRFMGPIVSGMGHCNGVAVYPPDVVHRIPNALRQSKAAFDFAMKDEMAHDCHDASKLITHVWGISNGVPSATDGANPPKNISTELARKLIKPSAVMVHRIKDDSLVTLMMNGGIR